MYPIKFLKKFLVLRTETSSNSHGKVLYVDGLDQSMILPSIGDYDVPFVKFRNKCIHCV